MPLQTKLSICFDEFRRRRLVRVAAVYAGITFVIIQIVDGAFPPLHIPPWVGSLVIIVMLIGFPLAIGLAWTIFPARHSDESPKPNTMPSFDKRAQPALDYDDLTMSPDKPVQSIAVLSFVDMSPEGDHEYFGDGMAEELIDTFTKIKGLQVAARSTSFAFKGKDIDIREVGSRLNVETVLEGSIRKSGNRLRVTAQLINVSSGFHIWSEKYERDFQDLFELQDEIAEKICNALGAVLTDQAKRSMACYSTNSIEAYDYYLRGREYFYQATLESMKFAIRMFQSAIEIDTRYARAYAGLADCHSWNYLMFGGAKEDIQYAIEASKTALEYDPNLAEAHVSYGWAVSLNGQFELAESEFEKAINLNPKLFESHFFYARTCWIQGKMEQAAIHFEKAAEINPDDYQALSLLVAVYDRLSKPELMVSTRIRASTIIEKRLELNPDDARALILGAAHLIATGDQVRGFEYTERAIAMHPDDPLIAYNAACVFARAGNADKALELLSNVVKGGFSHKEWIENDGDLTALRSDPRYRQLIDQMPYPAVSISKK